jgi:hypothetical protein
MSRAAVIDAIIAEPRLQALGFDNTNVLPNYDGNQRPSDKLFMVLRWEAHDIDVRLGRGPRHLAIWTHMYRDFSTDFNHLDNVIDIVDDVLGSMESVAGADGYTVTQIDPEGRSRDLKDDGYQTYCRSASYRVISHITPT